MNPKHSLGIAILGLCVLFSPAASAESAPAVLKAEKQATISANRAARVLETPFGTSEAFATGDLLISFDCARIIAEAEAARAAYRAAAVSASTQRNLSNLGAGGRGAANIAVAEAEAADKRAQVLELTARDCNIRAPFDGHVAELFVNPYEIPEAGAPLIAIVSAQTPVIDLLVPSTWLNWILHGTEFKLKVDETGTTYDAKVARIGAVVDPVSRRVRIEGELRNADANSLLPGMSGIATFAGPNEQP
ncbi:efflux RND transporter periplasmic adaptor subunit [Sagittula sp. SSi028]|uniref:efflux RND transporter periplasmic adaptor subunit n=1 Tax=Sagittula sp. SSi028 TaxID=3400636 RepID=UPI003AF94BD5